jgi:class 3 adenylate cyclase
MDESIRTAAPTTGRVLAWPGCVPGGGHVPGRAPRFDRRLVAILYTDVAGYSQLTDVDEDGTHARLIEYLDAIGVVIARHHGAVKHYAGDAVLAQLNTVSEAVACALEIQRILGRRNDGLPRASRLQFRIGINVGDVIADRDDLYGCAVNVAARLQALAAPGGICASEAVLLAAGTAAAAEFRSIGERRVKNIARSVRAYRVYEAGASHSDGWLAPAVVAVARCAREAFRAVRLCVARTVEAELGCRGTARISR